MEKRALTILGPFPPPLMGVSKNNEIIREALQENGIHVTKINTSVGQLSHSRSLQYHLARLAKNLRAVFGLIRSGERIYMVPDGGLGIIYSLLHVAAASLVSEQIFIHHRTFKYIERTSVCLRLALYLSRSKAIHIFLSPEMAAKFEQRYGHVSYLISGNACFVPALAARAPFEEPSDIVLGHLSNLCAEKGFFLAADLFERLATELPQLKFKVAGPVVEHSVDERLRKLAARFPHQFTYLGAVYGKEKERFFASVDFFVFPTLYPLEAQPNVVYEAMASGNIVLATDRGCIKEMVPTWAGLVVKDPHSFTTKAAAFVIATIEGQHLTTKKGEIAKHFADERDQARLQFCALLAALMRTDAPGAEHGDIAN